MSLEQSEILQRLSSGDQNELSRFLATMRPHIRQMIQRRISPVVRSRMDESDITQEALIRATKGIEAYLKDPQIHPIVWLRLVVKRVIAEVHRKEFRAKRNPKREIDWDGLSDSLIVNQIADSMKDVTDQAAQEELLANTWEAVKELPLIDKEIIEMRHLEEMSLAEAAEALEIGYETAKKRYYRALKKVRTRIATAERQGQTRTAKSES